MNDCFLKKEIKKWKKILIKNIRPSVLARGLRLMGVLIPINANKEWVAERLVIEMIANGSIK